MLAELGTVVSISSKPVSDEVGGGLCCFCLLAFPPAFLLWPKLLLSWQPITLDIKTETGQMIKMGGFTATSRILDVQEKLMNSMGISVCQQRLISKGSKLASYLTFHECKLDNSSMLELRLNLTGC